MSGSRTLIVNADDLGRSEGINRGILEAHRAGIVTSTTLMVNTPWAIDGAARAAKEIGLGIGLLIATLAARGAKFKNLNIAD